MQSEQAILEEEARALLARMRYHLAANPALQVADRPGAQADAMRALDTVVGAATSAALFQPVSPNGGYRQWACLFWCLVDYVNVTVTRNGSNRFVVVYDPPRDAGGVGHCGVLVQRVPGTVVAVQGRTVWEYSELLGKVSGSTCAVQEDASMYAFAIPMPTVWDSESWAELSNALWRLFIGLWRPEHGLLSVWHAGLNAGDVVHLVSGGSFVAGRLPPPSEIHCLAVDVHQRKCGPVLQLWAPHTVYGFGVVIVCAADGRPLLAHPMDLPWGHVWHVILNESDTLALSHASLLGGHSCSGVLSWGLRSLQFSGAANGFMMSTQASGVVTLDRMASLFLTADLHTRVLHTQYFDLRDTDPAWFLFFMSRPVLQLLLQLAVIGVMPLSPGFMSVAVSNGSTPANFSTYVQRLRADAACELRRILMNRVNTGSFSLPMHVLVQQAVDEAVLLTQHPHKSLVFDTVSVGESTVLRADTVPRTVPTSADQEPRTTRAPQMVVGRFAAITGNAVNPQPSVTDAMCARGDGSVSGVPSFLASTAVSVLAAVNGQGVPFERVLSYIAPCDSMRLYARRVFDAMNAAATARARPDAATLQWARTTPEYMAQYGAEPGVQLQPPAQVTLGFMACSNTELNTVCADAWDRIVAGTCSVYQAATTALRALNASIQRKTAGVSVGQRQLTWLQRWLQLHSETRATLLVCAYLDAAMELKQLRAVSKGMLTMIDVVLPAWKSPSWHEMVWTRRAEQHRQLAILRSGVQRQNSWACGWVDAAIQLGPIAFHPALSLFMPSRMRRDLSVPPSASTQKALAEWLLQYYRTCRDAGHNDENSAAYRLGMRLDMAGWEMGHLDMSPEALGDVYNNARTKMAPGCVCARQHNVFEAQHVKNVLVAAMAALGHPTLEWHATVHYVLSALSVLLTAVPHEHETRLWNGLPENIRAYMPDGTQHESTKLRWCTDPQEMGMDMADVCAPHFVETAPLRDDAAEFYGAAVKFWNSPQLEYVLLRLGGVLARIQDGARLSVPGVLMPARHSVMGVWTSLPHQVMFWTLLDTHNDDAVCLLSRHLQRATGMGSREYAEAVVTMLQLEAAAEARGNNAMGYQGTVQSREPKLIVNRATRVVQRVKSTSKDLRRATKRIRPSDTPATAAPAASEEGEAVFEDIADVSDPKSFHSKRLPDNTLSGALLLRSRMSNQSHTDPTHLDFVEYTDATPIGGGNTFGVAHPLLRSGWGACDTACHVPFRAKPLDVAAASNCTGESFNANRVVNVRDVQTSLEVVARLNAQRTVSHPLLASVYGCLLRTLAPATVVHDQKEKTRDTKLYIEFGACGGVIVPPSPCAAVGVRLMSHNALQQVAVGVFSTTDKHIVDSVCLMWARALVCQVALQLKELSHTEVASWMSRLRVCTLAHSSDVRVQLLVRAEVVYGFAVALDDDGSGGRHNMSVTRAAEFRENTAYDLVVDWVRSLVISGLVEAVRMQFHWPEEQLMHLRMLADGAVGCFSGQHPQRTTQRGGLHASNIPCAGKSLQRSINALFDPPVLQKLLRTVTPSAPIGYKTPVHRGAHKFVAAHTPPAAWSVPSSALVDEHINRRLQMTAGLREMRFDKVNVVMADVLGEDTTQQKNLRVRGTHRTTTSGQVNIAEAQAKDARVGVRWVDMHIGADGSTVSFTPRERSDMATVTAAGVVDLALQQRLCSTVITQPAAVVWAEYRRMVECGTLDESLLQREYVKTHEQHTPLEARHLGKGYRLYVTLLQRLDKTGVVPMVPMGRPDVRAARTEVLTRQNQLVFAAERADAIYAEAATLQSVVHAGVLCAQSPRDVLSAYCSHAGMSVLDQTWAEVLPATANASTMNTDCKNAGAATDTREARVKSTNFACGLRFMVR